MKRGEFGKSPTRGIFSSSPGIQGRKATVPEAVTKGLATHAAMCQLSGEGEATKSKMLTISAALTAGTEHEGKYSHGYALRKMRSNHPELVQPMEAISHENSRREWVTNKNLNGWRDLAKKELVDIGMLLDEPGEICKYN